jgi:hypothetical protein
MFGFSMIFNLMWALYNFRPTPTILQELLAMPSAVLRCRPPQGDGATLCCIPSMLRLLAALVAQEQRM